MLWTQQDFNRFLLIETKRLEISKAELMKGWKEGCGEGGRETVKADTELNIETAWEARKDQGWWATNNLCSPEKRKNWTEEKF